jgi:hypothetical protein
MPVDAEILALRTVLRDLVALSAIPAAWVGREPAAVAAGLADTLLGLLRLDFVYVRLCVPGVTGVVDATRGQGWKTFPGWLEGHLSERGRLTGREIVPRIDGDGDRCHPESDHALPAQLGERFSVKSMIAMAVYPKVDKPYLFGLQQCSYRRVWTLQEERLFHDIGRRLADALDTVLMFRNLRESERKLERSRAELAASRARIVTAADQTRLPEPVEVAAYYVVSEALTNTAKHARASAVRVTVEVRHGVLELSIRDDGAGGADPARGSGLIGLTDRVDALGGTIEVTSPAGAGNDAACHASYQLAGRRVGCLPGRRRRSCGRSSTVYVVNLSIPAGECHDARWLVPSRCPALSRSRRPRRDCLPPGAVRAAREGGARHPDLSPGRQR